MAPTLAMRPTATRRRFHPRSAPRPAARATTSKRSARARASPDLRRLQALDEEEWERLWRMYARRLYAYISKRVFDEEAREDVRQETMLGALRGIGGFDPAFSMEQYLFGICHNRTIDHLRRAGYRAGVGSQAEEAPAARPEPVDRRTPDVLAQDVELAERARSLFVALARQWVRETRAAGEWRRLMVVEALLGAGWRNKDAWRRFGFGDEKAVAGIKFRALRRLREMLEGTPARRALAATLRAACSEDPHAIGFDVARIWREGRVSCPDPAALRGLAADPGEREAIRFHLDELGCEACRAQRGAR